MSEVHPGWLAPIERLGKVAPLYVAHPLAAFLNDCALGPRVARLALFSLCESVEAVVRFLAIARAVEVIGESETGKAPQWLAKAAADNLLVPTFGKWINLLRIIAEWELKRRSALVPELAYAAKRFDSDLFARPPAVERPELHNLLDVRNPIAHGSGISDAYAQTLLAHWGPKVATVFARLGWLGVVALWTRDPAGFKRLNGPDPDAVPQEPPAAVRDALAIGGVALQRDHDVVKMYPLGRRALHRLPDHHVTQIFVRQSATSLVYSLFGADDALQSESDLTELERLDEMFDIESIRSARRDVRFQQRGYDGEFTRDAATFVGREEVLRTLWQTVVERRHGIVFVSGPAGIGKSSLVARIAEDLRAEIVERAANGHSKELLLAYRFIDGDRGCAPLPFLAWLIERLAAQKETAVKAGSDQTIDALRETALGLLRDCDNDRIILVLDGLDELARRERRFITDFVGRLAKVDRLLVLASSRPEGGIPEAMAAAGAIAPWSAGLPGMSRMELRAMLVNLLPSAARKLVGNDRAIGAIQNRFIDALVARAEGLPLYVRMVVHATHQKDFTLDKLSDPQWLPDGVADFFHRIVIDWASDRARLGPLVGCLLALVKEPLSANEISALLTRVITPRRASLIRCQYGLDPLDHRRRVAEQVLHGLGGLLRASIGLDQQRRFRLLHIDLQQYVRRSQEIADTMAEAQELLAIQASKPGDDAVSAYLFRNGVEHIVEGNPDPKGGAQEAAAVITNFRYQIDRLKALAPKGGDGGIRGDWFLINRVTAELSHEQREWLQYWRTDGAHFDVVEGGNGVRDFVECALTYASDTTVGAAVLGADLSAIRPLITPKFGERRRPTAEQAVLAGHTGGVRGAIELSSRRILSWDDETLRLWTSEGEPIGEPMRGHTGQWVSAIELRKGRILSRSWKDDTLRIWSQDGELVGEPMRGHEGPVRGAIELSSGRILSWAENDNALRLWTSDGERIGDPMRWHRSSVYGAMELSNGYILSWAQDDSLRLWSSDGATVGKPMEGHTGYVMRPIELSTGSILSHSSDGTLRLWSGEGKPVGRVMTHHVRSIISGAIELKNRHILSWDSYTMRLWSLNGEPIGEPVRSSSFSSVAELKSGRILSFPLLGGVQLWSPEGKLIRDLVRAEVNSHVSGAFELSSGRILAWAQDGSLWLWDSDGVPVREHNAGWQSTAIELSSGRILTWSWDGTLQVWSPDCEPVGDPLRGHRAAVVRVIELKSKHVLSWGGDKTLRLWNLDGELKSKRANLLEDAIELSSGRILSWAEDKLQVWNPDGSPLGKSIRGHSSIVWGAIELMGGRILSWSEDELRLCSGEFEPIGEPFHHPRWTSVVGAVRLSGDRILSWSVDEDGAGTLQVWSPDLEPIGGPMYHSEPVGGVLETLDSRILSWSEHELCLWSREGKQVAEPILGNDDSLWGAIRLSNGCILSWDLYGKLRLWSAEGQPIGEPWNASAHFVGGAIELSSRRILSWSNNGTLQQWSLEGQPIGHPMRGHNHAVLGAIEIECGYILSWSQENAIRLWSPDGEVKSRHFTWFEKPILITKGGVPREFPKRDAVVSPGRIAALPQGMRPSGRLAIFTLSQALGLTLEFV
jgi:hypothetical protein